MQQPNCNTTMARGEAHFRKLPTWHLRGASAPTCCPSPTQFMQQFTMHSLPCQCSMQVRDGYNLPLQNSTAFFFTLNPYPGLQGPQLTGSDNIMLLEVPPGQPALQWPFVSQGSDKEVTRAAAWKLGNRQLPDVLGGLVSSKLEPGTLGQPGENQGGWRRGGGGDGFAVYSSQEVETSRRHIQG